MSLYCLLVVLDRQRITLRVQALFHRSMDGRNGGEEVHVIGQRCPVAARISEAPIAIDPISPDLHVHASNSCRVFSNFLSTRALGSC